MTFARGDRVRYRSFDGDVYTATVTGVREPDRIDAAIDIPGQAHPVEFQYLPARRFEPIPADLEQPGEQP